MKVLNRTVVWWYVSSFVLRIVCNLRGGHDFSRWKNAIDYTDKPVTARGRLWKFCTRCYDFIPIGKVA